MQRGRARSVSRRDRLERSLGPGGRGPASSARRAGSSASRRRAMTPAPPSSPGTGVSWRTSSRPRGSTASISASSPNWPRASISSLLLPAIRQALDRIGDSPGGDRRDRGDRGARTDRMPSGRAGHGQGAGPLPRDSVRRRQSHRGSPSRDPGRSVRSSRPWSPSSRRAGTPSWCRWRTGGPTRSSARRATTRPARRSTRWRSFSGSAFPEDP